MSTHRLLACASLLVVLVAAACGGKVDEGFETPTPSALSPAPGTSPAPHVALADGGTGYLEPDGAVVSTPPPSASTCAAPALTCGDAFPGADPFSASTADDLVGVWINCPSATSTPLLGYYGGAEFAADGTYYNIDRNENGDYVRDLDPSMIWTWKVKAAGGGTPGLLEVVINVADGTLYGDYGLSTCPRSLVTDDALMLPATP